jgi:hypothetical protein
MYNADNNIDLPNMATIRKTDFIKYNYRLKDGYHVVDTMPADFTKPQYKDQKVEYRYNQDWFRSENFKNEHDGLHILFTGCSNTEGIGVNIENTWSYLLYKEIATQHQVDGYFNLSRSGSGVHITLHNLMVYVKKYGAPDYLFMLLPNILRSWKYDEDNQWRYYQHNVWQEVDKIDENIKEHRKEFPVWASILSVLIEYCNTIGTKVVWSIWDTWETENIINSNYFNDTFIPIGLIDQEQIKNDYSHILNHSNILEARDGHDGYLKQYHWYTNFKNKLVREGLLNETN